MMVTPARTPMTAERAAVSHQDREPGDIELAAEPSAEWGWHGEFPVGSLIAGWATTLIFVLILITRLAGTHSEGHVADVWLTVICTVLFLILVRRTRRVLRARRSQ